MSDNKIPTAEEFLNNLELEFQKSGKPFFYKDALKVFTKLHVLKALKEASENVKECSDEDGYLSIDKESILNAYPLENIK